MQVNNKDQVSDNSLKIASFNVRGFRNRKKISSVISYLKKEKYDIISLQETHILKSEKQYLQSQWKGEVHISEYTTHSKGLCTLFSKKFQSENIKLVYESSRILISSVKVNSQTIFIVNVYAPCIEKEKSNFLTYLYETINTHILSKGFINIICQGDFNMVLNNELDIISGEKHNVETVANFQKWVNELEFIDTGRMHNPTQKLFSWKRGSPAISRRLDYVFISQSLVPFFEWHSILSIGFSDHRLVQTRLKFLDFKRGTG